MYRIELGPDDIGVFRSIEEMATAIKTGVITPKARIFHSASDKWLPIEFHPHYKKAREMAAGPAEPPPPAPSPTPVRVTGDAQPKRAVVYTPSPTAGLPLIDVAAPAKFVAPPPPPSSAFAAPEPEPIVAEPAAPEPEPTAAPVSLALVHQRQPNPELEPAPEPASEPESEPESDALAVYMAPTVFAPLPLPEPERDAIFLAVDAETPRAEPEPATEPALKPTAAAMAVVSEPAPEQPRIAAALPSFQLPRVDFRLGRRRRPIVIAAAAVVLAASTHMALSAARPQWELGASIPLPFVDLGPGTLRAERPAGPSPTTATVLPASVPAAKGSPSFGAASAFSAPQPETAPPPPVDTATTRPPEPVIKPAPRIAIATPKAVTAPSLEGDLKSAAGLVARYDAAHAAARAELDNGLRTAGFANLFATTRLQPAGLREARASVGTASAYVARYRRREVDIERAYRDTFNLLSIRNKWSDGQRRTWDARTVRQEHPEVAKLSAFLLQSLDSLYGLLAAQEAAYRLTDGTITFEDAAAARAYGELRPWLDRRAHAWADVELPQPTSAARILKAMGTAKLPEGGSL